MHEDDDGQLVVLEGLEEFREHLGGRLTITLLKAIGKGFEVNEMNVPRVLESIRELNDLHADTDSKVIPAHG